jgi:hypothetical protein
MPGKAIVAEVDPTVEDERDTAPRAAAPDTSGKRIRAIPYQGGTEIVVRKEDFAGAGIDQDTVTWEMFKNNFTVKVGTDISKEAADFLTENYKESFEYMG